MEEDDEHSQSEDNGESSAEENQARLGKHLENNYKCLDCKRKKSANEFSKYQLYRHDNSDHRYCLKCEKSQRKAHFKGIQKDESYRAQKLKSPFEALEQNVQYYFWHHANNETLSVNVFNRKVSNLGFT